MSYFRLLPNELLLELSLYLNYRDTILACDILNCERPRLWIYKIHKELGYDNDFIREYVYDNTTQTMKTLLPLNEKYLELKARKTADFGTEFYQDIFVAIIYASRLKDFQLAGELIHYFITLTNVMSSADIRDSYFIAIRGTIATGNFRVANKLIAQTRELSQFTSFLNLQRAIVIGLFERYPTGNAELLGEYNIDQSNINQKNIVEGLAAGGHLEELKKIPNIDANDLYAASQLGRINVIKYYNLYTTVNINEMMRTGHIDLIPDFEHVDNREYITAYLIAKGYLEIMKRYEDILTVNYVLPANPVHHVLNNGLLACITYNHIDVLGYLYKRFGKDLVNYIRTYFGIYIMQIKFYNISDITFKYLIKNKILTRGMIKKIPQYSLEEMKKYNDDAYQYVMSLME